MAKGVKLDIEMRRKALECFEAGFGKRRTAGILGIATGTVEQWMLTYKSIGAEGLLSMGSKKTRYSFDTKLAAARAIVDEGKVFSDVMSEHGIASAGPLHDWVRKYRAGGAGALAPKPKAKPAKQKAEAGDLTREEELEAEVRKLRAEVAYLKKSIALKAEKRSRTVKKPRS